MEGIEEIPVQWAPMELMESQMWKMSTKTQGIFIRLKPGNDKDIIVEWVIMIAIVFKDLVLDDAPMERFVFCGGGNRMELSVDDDNGRRHRIRFEGVSAFKYHPSVCFDRGPFYVGGSYRKTILMIKESEWVKELNIRETEQLEPVSNNLNHCLTPSDEGVYEILAGLITLFESDGS